ncbi:hypothetical protein Dimus_016234 [Dionaea muscipula]
MSSPSHEWSWEPRVPIHPSLLEMTPLRIPSPAPDSPEYSCQERVIPYASEEGATSRGLVGVPPPYPLAARPEGHSPRKLRIKLKSRSLGESSQSRPETTTLYVVDAVNTLGPLPGEGIVSKEPPNEESPLTGRGRRGVGGRGRPDSPDRAMVSTRDPEDRDQRSSRDVEDRPPKPPSAELMRKKEVASDYPCESQKRRPPTGPIDFQDPFGGRESAVPLGGSAYGSSSSVTPASYAKERFK